MSSKKRTYGNPRYDISKTFQYFNLQNDLIKKTNKVSF